MKIKIEVGKELYLAKNPSDWPADLSELDFPEDLLIAIDVNGMVCKIGGTWVRDNPRNITFPVRVYAVTAPGE